MDELLAELAVRTRRTASRPGELAQALADGEAINVFAFRGAMHYLSPEEGGVYLALRAAGRQWEFAELGRVLPAAPGGLARLPRHRARRTAGRPADVAPNWVRR